MTRSLLRAVAVLASAGLIAVGLGGDVSSESLTGVSLGLLAWLLAALSLLVGRYQGVRRDPKDQREAAARELHAPLGVVTLAAALAHWHPRWRNLFGVLSLGLLWAVVLSLAWPGLRRVVGAQRAHRYAAHLLVALATVHGAQALFFAQN